MQEGTTDILTQLLKDASKFIYNGREFDFDNKDPIFFRQGPK